MPTAGATGRAFPLACGTAIGNSCSRDLLSEGSSLRAAVRSRCQGWSRECLSARCGPFGRQRYRGRRRDPARQNCTFLRYGYLSRRCCDYARSHFRDWVSFLDPGHSPGSSFQLFCYEVHLATFISVSGGLFADLLAFLFQFCFYPHAFLRWRN